MKHRLDIDHNEIVSVVCAGFNIDLQDLEFLPIGEGSWVYKGIDKLNDKWFIKLSRIDTSNVARVTSYLHDELGLSFVLSPILNKDQNDQRELSGTHLTIYPFIEGQIIGTPIDNKYKSEIANDLRLLHDVNLPRDLATVLPSESFDKFQDSARRLVEKARTYNGSDALIRQLAHYIQRHTQVVEAILINGRLISNYCRSRKYEMVVCHADIHPFNIMRTSHGLMMIDWDSIMLAPRERDLMFYGGSMRSNTDFHKAYGSNYTLNENLITYYNYEWVLQEYTDYITRLFDPSLSDEARSHALDEFRAISGSDDELGGVVKTALDSPLPMG